MSHLATPRKSEHTLPGHSGSWTLRSAGGNRPALIVWGTSPGDATLDRLARSGLAVITPPLEVPLDDFLDVIREVGLGSVAFAFTETPEGDLPKALDARAIPWLHVNDNWDDVPRWCAGQLQ